MVLYAGFHFRRHQIPARFLKEFEHGVVLEGGRVREVDNHLGILQYVRQALAGEGVDAGFRAAAMTSCPFLRKRSAVFEPIRPVPPMITIFMRGSICEGPYGARRSIGELEKAR